VRRFGEGLRIGLPGLLVLLLAGPARADAPARHGFTFELGLGGGMTILNEDLSSITRPGNGPIIEDRYTRTRVFGAIAPLSFGIGGFLTERVALLFRAAGTAYIKTLLEYAELNNFYGAVVEVWPSERLMWSAGLGLGFHGPNPLDTGEVDLGVAASLRGHYALLASSKQTLGLSLELTPAVYQFDRIMGVALNVEWHRW
jgi:hypothetical protein